MRRRIVRGVPVCCNPVGTSRASTRRRHDPTRPRAGRSALCALALLAGTAAAQDTDHAGALADLVYRVEVASYCSLVAPLVAEGFRRERDRIIAAGSLQVDDVEQARMEGWKRADAEWQNRGLGGFRNWCRTEGLEAADFFRGIATQP